MYEALAPVTTHVRRFVSIAMLLLASVALAQLPVPTTPPPFDPSQMSEIEVVGTLEGTLDGEPSSWEVFAVTVEGARDMSLAYWTESGIGTQLFMMGFPNDLEAGTYLLLTAEVSALPSGCPCTLEGDGVFAAILPMASEGAMANGGMGFLQNALFSGFDDGSGGGPPTKIAWRFDSFTPNGDGTYAATGAVSATLLGFQDLMMGMASGDGQKLDLRFDIARFTPEPQ